MDKKETQKIEDMQGSTIAFLQDSGFPNTFLSNKASILYF